MDTAATRGLVGCEKVCADAMTVRVTSLIPELAAILDSCDEDAVTSESEEMTSSLESVASLTSLPVEWYSNQELSEAEEESLS